LVVALSTVPSSSELAAGAVANGSVAWVSFSARVDWGFGAEPFDGSRDFAGVRLTRGSVVRFALTCAVAVGFALVALAVVASALEAFGL
jgi:hypothetical protein